LRSFWLNFKTSKINASMVLLLIFYLFFILKNTKCSTYHYGNIILIPIERCFIMICIPLVSICLLVDKKRKIFQESVLIPIFIVYLMTNIKCKYIYLIFETLSFMLLTSKFTFWIIHLTIFCSSLECHLSIIKIRNKSWLIV